MPKIKTKALHQLFLVHFDNLNLTDPELAWVPKTYLFNVRGHPDQLESLPTDIDNQERIHWDIGARLLGFPLPGDITRVEAVSPSRAAETRKQFDHCLDFIFQVSSPPSMRRWDVALWARKAGWWYCSVEGMSNEDSNSIRRKALEKWICAGGYPEIDIRFFMPSSRSKKTKPGAKNIYDDPRHAVGSVQAISDFFKSKNNSHAR